MNVSAAVVLVWGRGVSAPPGNHRVVLWENSPEEEQHVSLPQIIHSNPAYWQSEYARWLRDVGSTYVDTPEARKFEAKHGGLSYWWMSLPTHFTFTRQSVPYAVLRLMALCDVLHEAKPARVVMAGLPSAVEAVLKRWGEDRGVAVEAIDDHASSLPTSTESDKANRLAGLKYVLSSLRHHGLHFRKPHGDGLVVVDYLTDLQGDRDGYTSRFWGPLISLLETSISTLWLHQAVRSSSPLTSRNMRKLTRSLSASSERHFLMQDALSPKTLARALLTLYRIWILGKSAWLQVSFRDHDRGIDLRPVVQNSWFEDHQGTTAGMNALNIQLIYSAVARTDGPALYLMENQPWEMALLNAWQHKEKPIHGFVHSLVREWDLRFLVPNYGPVGTRRVKPPTPDKCLVGSRTEAQILSLNGYLGKDVVEVEALRFLGTEFELEVPLVTNEPARVLVLGEYDLQTHNNVLSLIMKSDLPDVQVVLRPHPSRSVARETLPEVIELSSETSLIQDLSRCDLVIATTTSTAIQAVVTSRKPMILIRDRSVLDGTNIDVASYFPLSSQARISRALIDKALTVGTVTEYGKGDQHLDAELGRWKNWIGSIRSSGGLEK